MFSERAKELYTVLKNEFPYAEIFLWESKELHSYMIHQPLSHNIFIELEKELLETVFHLLYDRGENVIIVEKEKIGIGTKLLRLIYEKAKKENVDEMYLTVHEKKEKHLCFISFIEKHGFIHRGYKNKERVYVKTLKEIP